MLLILSQVELKICRFDTCIVLRRISSERMRNGISTLKAALYPVLDLGFGVSGSGF